MLSYLPTEISLDPKTVVKIGAEKEKPSETPVKYGLFKGCLWSWREANHKWFNHLIQ
jgi:hypothetical protein